jgi:hypothetical protein
MPSDAAGSQSGQWTSACRNCGAPAPGAFCPACGQETRIELPTARVFLREAMGRYVALDGRLWRTLAALLFRPGFLTREYFAGRRKRYIRPARIFLVLSLALFAAIRIFAEAPIVDRTDGPAAAKPAGNAKSPVGEPEKSADGMIDVPGFAIRLDPDLNLEVEGGDERWTRALKKRIQRFNHLTSQEKVDQVFAGAVRYGPYAMFVLMPVYALILQAAYLGRGRRYPGRPRRYAEHLVFAAHTHGFLFLVGVLLLAIPNTPLRIGLAIWWLCYGLWATKSVYRGRWIGLLLRAFVVSIAYLVAFALVTVGLLFSAVLLQ